MFFKGPGESFEYFGLKDITHANNLAKKYEAASENPTVELYGFSARFEPKITNSQVSVHVRKTRVEIDRMARRSISTPSNQTSIILPPEFVLSEIPLPECNTSERNEVSDLSGADSVIFPESSGYISQNTTHDVATSGCQETGELGVCGGDDHRSKRSKKCKYYQPPQRSKRSRSDPSPFDIQLRSRNQTNRSRALPRNDRSKANARIRHISERKKFNK
jgi:hypothetical protein